MASAAAIFTACLPATFVVAAKSRADQGLAKACAGTKIDNVPGGTGARSSSIYHDAYRITGSAENREGVAETSYPQELG